MSSKPLHPLVICQKNIILLFKKDKIGQCTDCQMYLLANCMLLSLLVN